MTNKLNPQHFDDYLDANMQMSELLTLARHTDQVDGIVAIVDFLVEELSAYISEAESDSYLAAQVSTLIADLARPVVHH